MPRVLVIDDDDPFRAMIVNVLKQCGHEIKEANNGRQALALIAEFKPEVVITDIIMPEKDGLELIPEFRRRTPAKIIACTGGGGMDAEELLKLAKLLGANQVLLKPFPLADLTSAVESLAGQTVLQD